MKAQRLHGRKMNTALRLIFLSLTVFAGITNAHSQTFSAELTRIPHSGQINATSSAHFIDIDNDGDLDFLCSPGNPGNFQLLYSNIGTASSPSFEKPYMGPYGFKDFACVTFADIDGDGDFDASGVVFSQLCKNQTVNVWRENIGTPEKPEFKEMADFGFNLAKGFRELKFVDIDGDGDLDVFGFTTSSVAFQENVGNSEEMDLAEKSYELFGLPFISSAIFDFADIDNDGDYDAYCFGKLNDAKDAKQYILLNSGNKNAPSFPEMISSTEMGLDETLEYIQFVDIDGDGDKDAVGTVKYKLYYQENLSIE